MSFCTAIQVTKMTFEKNMCFMQIILKKHRVWSWNKIGDSLQTVDWMAVKDVIKRLDLSL